MRRSVVVAAVAAFAATIGCASGRSSVSGSPAAAESAPPFDNPRVSLRDVRLAGVGLTGGAMEIVLRVYNPNSYPLEDPRIAYRVMVGDNQLASGVHDTEVDVPAEDSALVRVPASFTFGGAGGAGRAVLSTGSVNYRVLGRIYADTPYGRLSAPYDRAGTYSTVSAVGWPR
jgi:hypothetical protein